MDTPLFKMFEAQIITSNNPFDRRFQPVYVVRSYAVTVGRNALPNYSFRGQSIQDTRNEIITGEWVFDRKEEAAAFFVQQPEGLAPETNIRNSVHPQARYQVGSFIRLA